MAETVKKVKPVTGWTTVAIDREQHRELRRIASAPPRESVSALVRRIIHEYLRRGRHA